MSETALVIMARYPEKGKSKTRLAQSLGEEATLSLYRAFLSDLAQRFAGWIYDLHWTYTPVEADFSGFAATLAPAHTASMHSFAQRGPDLGARLLHAFQTARARQFQRTIVISSDSPQISRTTIAQAEEALDLADVVLGPAEDGGYYLIAMRQPHDVFTSIPMSTSSVLQMTVDKAQQQGLSVCLLEPLFDIDELSDLERLAVLLQAEPALAPATAACLAQIMKEPAQ